MTHNECIMEKLQQEFREASSRVSGFHTGMVLLAEESDALTDPHKIRCVHLLADKVALWARAMSLAAEELQAVVEEENDD